MARRTSRRNQPLCLQHTPHSLNEQTMATRAKFTSGRPCKWDFNLKIILRYVETKLSSGYIKNGRRWDKGIVSYEHLKYSIYCRGLRSAHSWCRPADIGAKHHFGLGLQKSAFIFVKCCFVRHSYWTSLLQGWHQCFSCSCLILAGSCISHVMNGLFLAAKVAGTLCVVCFVCFVMFYFSTMSNIVFLSVLSV